VHFVGSSARSVAHYATALNRGCSLFLEQFLVSLVQSQLLWRPRTFSHLSVREGKTDQPLQGPAARPASPNYPCQPCSHSLSSCIEPCFGRRAVGIL